MHRLSLRIGLLTVLVALGLPCRGAVAQLFNRGEVDESDLIAGREAVEDGFFDLGRKHLEQFVDSSPDRARKAEATVYLARVMMAQGQPEEALELLDRRRKWAKGNPAEPAFRYWTALALRQTGRQEDALKVLTGMEKSFEGDVHVPGAVLLRAQCLTDLARYDEALAEHGALFERFPDAEVAPDNLTAWGELLSECGRAAEAETVWRDLFRLYPRSLHGWNARFRLGKTLAESGRADEALTLLQPLIDDPETSPHLRVNALLAMASIQQKRGETGAALAAAEQVMTIAKIPQNRAKAGIIKGRLLMDEGLIDEGAAALREAIPKLRDEEKAAETQMYLANMLQASELHEQAVGAYQNYLEAFAEDAGVVSAMMGKGWSLWALKRYAEAAGVFDKAASLTRDGTVREEALLKAADACFADRQYTLAEQRYDEFIAAYPESERVQQAWFQKAEALARGGNEAGAFMALEALAEESEDPELARQAVLRKGLLHEQAGRWHEAEAVYTAVIAQDGATNGVVDARLRRGLVRYRAGRFEDALSDFDSIVGSAEGSSESEEAFYMRGWCLYMMGDDKKARDICISFIEQFPGSALIPKVMFWIGENEWNGQAYVEAERWFLRLVDGYPQHPLSEKALYWASRAASEMSEYLRASEHVSELVRLHPKSGLMPEMRLLQGDVLSELGQFSGAILAFEEIIKNWPNSYLVDRAWGRKGDCQFTLGTEGTNATVRLERFEQALTSFSTVYESATAPAEVKLQALYKIGRCLEKLARKDEAFEQYMKVVYDFIAGLEAGETEDPFWFTRAAFSAAGMMEAVGKWEEAVRIYQRVVDAKVPASDEAAKRVVAIQLEHLEQF